MAKREEQSSPDPIAEGLGRAIRVLRTGRDLGRRELAERAGLSYSFLAEIENGAKSPSSKALALIAAALGMAVHELVAAAEAWRTPAKAPTTSPAETWRTPTAQTWRKPTAGLALHEQGRYPAREVEPPELEGALSADLAPRNVPVGRTAPRPGRGIARSFGAGLEHVRALGRLAAPDDGVPAELVDEIRNGHCVAFVGAGFSRAARLPGWGELLKGIALAGGVGPETRAHVEARVAKGSSAALDEAAQVLEDELGRARLLGALEAQLARPALTDAMERRICWLRGIPFRAILTTNFDGLLAGETPGHEAYRRALRPDEYRWWAPRFWSGGKGAFTLKLHGDLARAEERAGIVLTRRDYRRRLYEDPAYATFLRAVMATTTVLYMGFSFEDAYLNELRSEVLALLGQRRESAPVAFAIVNDVPEATRRHFADHEGIQILSYETGGGRDFSGFDRWLGAIHDATNPLLRFARYLERKRILWVDPHPENNEIAFEYLRDAAAAAGRASTALVPVPTADAGLGQIEQAASREPFDLAITHWGEGAARDDAGRRVPAAVRLLTGIRARDLRCPVVVFAGSARGTELDLRKRTALGLGAQAYCYRFETLYQAIERVLAPGEETG
jgi:transcriptional regulator with XRE-family HTH domain